jgi:hypothetical protein
VRIRWKFSLLAAFASLPLLVAGCGGISASRSVSPLDFLLPGVGGFIKAGSVSTNAPGAFPAIAAEVASVK